jgi:hypothetical protein
MKLLPEKFDDTNLQLIGSLIELKTQAGLNALKVALENVVLLDKKQLDYGPANIIGFGLFGVVVRMNDKFERVKHIFNKTGRKRRAVNESVRDTFRDIANYSTIALLLDTNSWPTVDTLLTSPSVKSQPPSNMTPLPKPNPRYSSTETDS